MWLLAAYSAGVIHAAYHLGFDKNPTFFSQVQLAIEKYGFPLNGFLFFALIFTALTTWFVIAIYHSTDGKDVMGREFKHTGKDTYGGSHFETEDEYRNVAVVQPPEEAYGTIFGQLDDKGQKLINFKMSPDQRLNRHIAVVGASGTGKTFSFAKPYCYQTVKRRESIIITDPDGGLYRDTAAYFEKHGYIVRRFDLTNLARSHGWDCMKAIRPETAELDAQMFSQVVISNLVDDLSSIYASGPQSLLKALILRVYLAEDLKPEEKNIGKVYSYLQNPGGEEFLDALFDPQTLTEKEMPCYGPYQSFKTGSPNLRGNLITNLSVQLQLLQNSMVRKVLSTDDIDLTLPGYQPCAYFCVMPDNHSTYQFIVSLFFSMMFINLINEADDRIDGKMPIPVNFLMDEFPSIGKLPDWDRKMATIRKRNLHVVMIFQTLTQFKNLYQDAWVTILSNCATWLVIGLNDSETAELINTRIGETTIEVSTKKKSPVDIKDPIRMASQGEGKRSMLTIDELYKLDINDVLIIFQQHNPIWAKKYPHMLHPDSKELVPIDPKSIPSIMDTETRQRLKEEEARRVEEYNRLHPLEEVDRTYANIFNQAPKKQKESFWKKKEKSKEPQKPIIPALTPDTAQNTPTALGTTTPEQNVLSKPETPPAASEANFSYEPITTPQYEAKAPENAPEPPKTARDDYYAEYNADSPSPFDLDELNSDTQPEEISFHYDGVSNSNKTQPKASAPEQTSTSTLLNNPNIPRIALEKQAPKSKKKTTKPAL